MKKRLGIIVHAILLSLPIVALAGGAIIFDATGASGGTVVSGAGYGNSIDTTYYDQALVSLSNSGSGVSGVCTFSAVKPGDATVPFYTAGTVAAGGNTLLAFGPGMAAGTVAGTNAMLPTRVAVSCAGATNATMRVTIWGRGP